jgi:peptide/nickel transport system permease protein
MVMAGAALATIILMAVFAPLVTPYAAGDIDLSRRLQAPSLAHWFGTDALGQDVFTQVVYGARLSLLSGVSAVFIAVAIGAPIGFIAAYYGGWLDSVLMRTSDLFIAFPPLLLPIAITAALGPGLVNAMIAVGLSWFPWYARLTRASALSTGTQLYVKSAQCAGLSGAAVMTRHILPNSVSPLLVQASMDFGYAILAAASLSFIGAGAQPPAIEWGLMISQSRVFVLDYLWVVLFPGLAIFVTVLAVNVFSDGVRDVLDPNFRSHR